MESFSQHVKNSLVEIEYKHKCCKRMFSIGLAFDDNSGISIVDSTTLCDNCLSAFYNGLFVSCGSLTDPNKQYHLEFSFYIEKNAKEIIQKLSEQGLDFKMTVRKEKYIVYTKSSTTIEDFFAFIGANNIVFELMNTKIDREMKNNINRVVNCDTANVSKIVNASKKYILIIDALENGHKLEKMPQDIRETAILRKKYPQATIQELGQYHNPQISKSGVNHRLHKIEEYYDFIQLESEK